MSRQTLGSFELVSLPELGLQDTVAKIDTGAYSGAVHCTGIKVSKQDGVPVLTFHPAGEATLTHQTTDFSRRKVRSSNGHLVRRYVIRTTIVIQGREFPVEIGLSDRSDMRKQVLIGRRFIRDQKMLVDVTRNTEYDDEGEPQS